MHPGGALFKKKNAQVPATRGRDRDRLMSQGPDGWNRFKRAAAKLTGQVLVATASAVGAIIAVSKEEENGDARAEEKALLAAHREYSSCMADIYEFKIAHGAGKYDKAFIRAMASSKRSGAVKRVNACRAITRGYWEMAISWMEDHPQYIRDRPGKRRRFASKYRRFVELVAPLNRLPGYTEEDRAIFYQKKHFD